MNISLSVILQYNIKVQHRRPKMYHPSNTQTVPTQPDIRAGSNQQPSQVQAGAPTSLKVLLGFVVIQALFAIGVLVVQIVFGYLGFTGTTPLTIDKTTCTTNYAKLSMYESAQKYIMMISLVGVAVCILLSIVILIIVSKAVHQSKKLPAQTYTVSSPTLTISTLYQVIGPKTRAFLYILQSICMLGIITVLGYYLIFYLKMKLYGCGWTASDAATKVLIVWAIAAGLFVVGWIVWIIIVVINVQNRSDEVYQDQQKPEAKKAYNNLNTTENNTQVFDNTRKQFVPPVEENKYNSGRYYNAKREEKEQPKYGSGRYYNARPEEKEEPLNKIKTLDSEKEQYAIKEPNNEKRYYYASPKNEKNEKNEYYNNPVFENRKELYGSPYDRIENGRYYQGDRDQKRDNQPRPEMMPVSPKYKQKQNPRPRFNANNYDSQNHYERQSPVKQSDQYLKALSRYRLEQQQKDPYRSTQSRQYFPESDHSSNKQFEGASRPKLHSNYFKEDGPSNKKQRERKGILNDYIRGKYTDN